MKTRLAIMAIAAAGSIALAALSMPAFAGEAVPVAGDPELAVNAEHCEVRQQRADTLWKTGKIDAALAEYAEITRRHASPHPLLQRPATVTTGLVRIGDAGHRDVR